MRNKIKKMLDNGIDIDSADIMLIDDDAICDSLVGVSYSPHLRAVYNHDKLVEDFMKGHGMTQEDALDYVEYNIVRALSYYGNQAPIVFEELS